MSLEVQRLAIGRVRLRSVLRVGCSIGWIISLLPAILFSILLAWTLHNAWTTLDAMMPWRPWPADTSILGVRLPSPELHPREVLHVERPYQALEPFGRHPILSGIVCTLLLTTVGGVLVALMMFLTGVAYNLFSRAIGGLEFDVVTRGRRQRMRADEQPASWSEINLRW